MNKNIKQTKARTSSLAIKNTNIWLILNAPSADLARGYSEKGERRILKIWYLFFYLLIDW
jgi:hypothetical protein